VLVLLVHGLTVINEGEPPFATVLKKLVILEIHAVGGIIPSSTHAADPIQVGPVAS
jgi:hypothetical protein